MENKKIFVTSPSLPPLAELMPYLEKIWADKRLTNNSQFHQQLEKNLADFLGVKHISLFANGTLALLTALQALEIRGEVITTPYTFVATTNALWWNRIDPVFVDIERNTCNLDPDKIETAITDKTTAILPVHVYGNPCDSEAIEKIAIKNDLKIIYDAAHAFGINRNGHSILNYGDLSVLSFHATKVFNTFEGGAIISHSIETKERIDFLKNFGFQNETTIVAPGINGKMNEFQAALGLIQLSYFEKNRSRSKEIHDIYVQRLKEVKGIRLPKPDPEVKHNYSYFPVFVDQNTFPISRDALYHELRDHGIHSRRYFYPLTSNIEIFSRFPSADKKNLAVANRIADEVICLPIYPDLDNGDVEKIIRIIKGIGQ